MCLNYSIFTIFLLVSISTLQKTILAAENNEGDFEENDVMRYMSPDMSTATTSTKPVGIIIIYDDTSYQGNPRRAQLDTNCRNIAKMWRKKIKSMDTMGHCVVMHNMKDCQDSGTIMHRHSFECKDIQRHVGTPRSIHLCSGSETHKLVFHPSNDPYNPNSRLAVYEFPLDGTCVNVQQRHNDEADSVAFIPPFGCIHIYDEYECRGNPTRLTMAGPPLRDNNGATNILILSGHVCSRKDRMHLMYLETMPVATGNAEGDTDGTEGGTDGTEGGGDPGAYKTAPKIDLEDDGSGETRENEEEAENNLPPPQPPNPVTTGSRNMKPRRLRRSIRNRATEF